MIEDLQPHAIDYFNCIEDDKELKYNTKLARALYKSQNIHTINNISTVERERKGIRYPAKHLYENFLLQSDFYTYGEEIDDTIGDFLMGVDQIVTKKNAAVVNYVYSKAKKGLLLGVQSYIDMLTSEGIPVYIYHNSDRLCKDVNTENVVCFKHSNLKSGAVLVTAFKRLCTHNDKIKVRNGAIKNKKYIQLAYDVPDFCVANTRKFYV
jgi:hypothetical protein